MNKKEFLDILRQSLSGEVSPNIIEENIKYYNQYISSSSLEEELRIIESLGDPRLIAKTIIEKERAANQKGQFNHNYDYYNTYNHTEDNGNTNDLERDKGFFKSLSLSHKITSALILIGLVIALFIIGRLVIGFLFAFGIPIIIILLLLAIFNKRN